MNHIRIAFRKNRPPTVEDIYRAIEQALGVAGCTRCGFDGLDVAGRISHLLPVRGWRHPLPRVRQQGIRGARSGRTSGLSRL